VRIIRQSNAAQARLGVIVSGSVEGRAGAGNDVAKSAPRGRSVHQSQEPECIFCFGSVCCHLSCLQYTSSRSTLQTQVDQMWQDGYSKYSLRRQGYHDDMKNLKVQHHDFFPTFVNSDESESISEL
jgi:hypothetical protein